MSNGIRIVGDGTVNGTRIYNHDGTEIHGVTKLEILPVDAEKEHFMRARLHFTRVNFDLTVPRDDAPQADALTDEQREAIEWAAGRAHVESLGKPIDGVERRRWRTLSDLFRQSAGE